MTTRTSKKLSLLILIMFITILALTASQEKVFAVDETTGCVILSGKGFTVEEAVVNLEIKAKRKNIDLYDYTITLIK